MDSLFATYASSDDEDDHHHPPPQQPPPPIAHKSTSSFFSSLPKPSSSASSTSSSSKPSSSLFSLLPPPTSQITPNPIPIPNPKKIIQFHPPQFSSRPIHEDDEDEDDEEFRQEKEAKKRKQSAAHDTSIKSFLSAMPAPKNSSTSSLGAATSGARRSIIDTGPSPSPAPTPTPTPAPVSEVGIEHNMGYADYANYEVGYGGDGDGGGYVGYGEGEQQVQYYDDGCSWSNNGGDGVAVSSSMVEGVSTEVASFVGMGGGRRRKDQVPPQIVEVKQDELMKNRPTEDKSKLTGLAFGPSYQPASSKGKPSKLHKRKHQIGSLYFDMRQNEPELAERRAKGFLTKAETHAKYGW